MWFMHKFIIHSNAGTSLFQLFWEHCRRALELENGVGDHHCRYTGVDVEPTNNMSHAPGVLHVSHLIKVTVGMLKKDCKA